MLPEGLAPSALGEFEKLPLLAGEPLNGVGVRANLGGVAYVLFGVGGAELGGKPSSFRCPGVSGISERSSFARRRGQHAATALKANTDCMQW